ncbi:hypothetical protein R69658_07393 [Paraburkholderia aspalathi]|uniref:Uncharacterized protein n=1 Tax=Paraburkholderia aspalathi TaxID=1324617 RepID=A0A1I7BQ54_9BURK|nr:hypothetical protein R69658_07393 [Paraburkholderia aspalathi]SFT89340.1 hypothetical protein SAMN05192563_100522 [Paraburkholderia aspalathi]
MALTSLPPPGFPMVIKAGVCVKQAGQLLEPVAA